VSVRACGWRSFVLGIRLFRGSSCASGVFECWLLQGVLATPGLPCVVVVVCTFVWVCVCVSVFLVACVFPSLRYF